MLFFLTVLQFYCYIKKTLNFQLSIFRCLNERYDSKHRLPFSQLHQRLGVLKRIKMLNDLVHPINRMTSRLPAFPNTQDKTGCQRHHTSPHSTHPPAPAQPPPPLQCIKELRCAVRVGARVHAPGRQGSGVKCADDSGVTERGRDL